MLRIPGIPTVTMSEEEWADLLSALGPRGPAWEDRTNWLYRVWRGFAPALKAAHDRLLVLLAEIADPAAVNELTDTWVELLELPEPDTTLPTDPDELRALVASYITRSRWGQSIPWYIALAATVGATVTIDKPAGCRSHFRVTSSDGDWAWPRCGEYESGTDFGTWTPRGGQVVRLFERAKRAHARIIWN